LLHRIIDADWAARQLQMIAQFCIRHPGDAGGTVTGQVHGNAVRFPVVKCVQNTLAGIH